MRAMLHDIVGECLWPRKYAQFSEVRPVPTWDITQVRRLGAVVRGPTPPYASICDAVSDVELQHGADDGENGDDGDDDDEDDDEDDEYDGDEDDDEDHDDEADEVDDQDDWWTPMTSITMMTNVEGRTWRMSSSSR